VKELQTMKQLMQLSIVLLAITGTSWTAEPSSSVKQAVLNAESAWKNAVLKSDGNALDKLLSSDLSYTHSSSKTQTKEQFIQDVTSHSTSYKSIDFENTKLRQYGEVVVVTQSALITTAQTGTSHLYLTEVWARQGGHWQMVSRQATKLP
jgi:ketosteroid isomerase-like protein